MRWIIRIFGALALLVVLALGALFLLPTDRIAKIAADRISLATGRTVTIDGPVSPTLWPVLGVSTGPVSIANAAWSGEGPMLEANSLAIAVDVKTLIGGDVQITKVLVEAPSVVLEVSADGAPNWDFGTADTAQPETTAAPDSTGSTRAFGIEMAEVTDARVTYIDHAGGTRLAGDGITARLSLPSLAGAADLDLSGRLNGQSFETTARVAGVTAFLNQGAVPVTLNATVGGSTIAFDGRAGLTPMAAAGKVTAQLNDLAALFALIGQAPPALPPGLGQRIGFEGEVTYTDAGKASLRGGALRLDQNALTVDADLDLAGAKPYLTARMTAGALDFSALAGPEETEGGDAAASTADDGPSGWSTDPIDVSALQALDAEVSIRAESIDLGTSTLGATRLLISLKDGRAVTEIEELRAYDGALTGSFVVNSRGGLSVRANLAGSGVALRPLLQQLAGFERLEGAGDVRINLLGVGNSMDALMKSLEGDGAVALGSGSIAGFDLVGMLRNLDTSYVGEGYQTIFDSIEATFDVAGGQLQNPDLSFLSSLITAEGDGRIGLGTQDMDYRLVPVLLKSAGDKAVRVPLDITGPWNDLRFRLDLEALVNQEFGDEIEEVKDAVEAEVTERINDKLGTDLENLDNVEDVLKEKAAEGILKLLGGN